MTHQSVWATPKPYIIIVVLAAVGFWWFNNQSSLAMLKDGSYTCQGVYVNEDQKYQVLVDEAGGKLRGSAVVSGGEVTSLAGDTSMASSEIASLNVRTTGTKHFHVTDQAALRMYYAMACDFSG